MTKIIVTLTSEDWIVIDGKGAMRKTFWCDKIVPGMVTTTAVRDGKPFPVMTDLIGKIELGEVDESFTEV